MRIEKAMAVSNGIVFSYNDNMYKSRWTSKGLNVARTSEHEIGVRQETSLKEVIFFAFTPMISIILGLVAKTNFQASFLAGISLFILTVAIAFWFLLRRRYDSLTYQFHTVEHKLCNFLDKYLDISELHMDSLKTSDWFHNECGSLYSIQKFYFITIYAACLNLILPYLLVFPKGEFWKVILPNIYTLFILLLGLIIKKIVESLALKPPFYRLTRLLQKRFHLEPTEEQYQFGLALGRYLISTEQ